MNRFRAPSRNALRRFVSALLLYLYMLPGPATAQMGGVPQIPAFLPTVDQVPATRPMPLDGTWLVASIGKKIRIEGGRGYAVDGWVHLFVLKIQPGMVVLKNIAPTGPGKYSGDDLPLMGKLTATVQADRSISVSVAGTLGPANYKLVPVQIDNPQWYAQEMQAAGLTPMGGSAPAAPAYQFTPPGNAPPPAPGYQPSPGYGRPPQPPAPPPSAVVGDCEVEQFDPRTGSTVCLD